MPESLHAPCSSSRSQAQEVTCKPLLLTFDLHFAFVASQCPELQPPLSLQNCLLMIFAIESSRQSVGATHIPFVNFPEAGPGVDGSEIFSQIKPLWTLSLGGLCWQAVNPKRAQAMMRIRRMRMVPPESLTRGRGEKTCDWIL